jgi:hypothetical protein
VLKCTEKIPSGKWARLASVEIARRCYLRDRDRQQKDVESHGLFGENAQLPEFAVSGIG